MSEPDGDGARVRVVLDLAVAVEPITGSVRVPDGREYGFCGWIELTHVLDAIRRQAEPSA